ncbi:PATL4 [Linum perenne]
MLKYISIEQIPVQYGRFKRENDYEFTDEEITEVPVKAGSTAVIEIPATEVSGGTLLVGVGRRLAAGSVGVEE